MKRSVYIAAAILAVAIPTAALALPKVGQPAPVLALSTTAGKPFVLSSLKGKAVYLNFFASWCGPCNEEASSIGKLSAKYKAKGLTVVGVNELESAQKAEGFLKQYHLPYGAILDSDGKVGRDYGAIGLPLHVFIDRNGNIKSYRLGEMSPAEIEAAIKETL
jgi:thiol-disulfide isomerase/thioredoxin